MGGIAMTTKQRNLAKADPILLELWEIKRQVNTAARFDIAQLARQANQFDIKKALAALRTAHQPIFISILDL
jgi:hypothetical protein